MGSTSWVKTADLMRSNIGGVKAQQRHKSAPIKLIVGPISASMSL